MLTVGLFIRSYYQLLSLTATCAQANIPKLRIEGVLFPHFVGSEFRCRDFFSELERCQHLFWSLTGESVESFTRIVRDVGPTVYFQTRRGHIRRHDYPYILDMRNRVLLVIIWLRMYPEVTMLSGMFMVSPTTVEREIRFLLPLLWHYFKELVKWPTVQQWLQMANHWEMLPGAVAVIDGTRHEIQRPQTEPRQLFYFL